jgi:LDH2 family malate/lactate/ureidoglycolate dehydrogenase
MITVPIEDVEAWATDVLTSLDLAQHDAGLTAASLAYAESRGVNTHGFIRLGTYVERIRAGGINPRGTPHVVDDVGALVIVSADNAMGACSAMFAADIAIERARQHGIGCVVSREANHFGCAGFYSNHIADAGFLSIVSCNTDKMMSPPFGGRAVLGTNPLAVAVPLPYNERPQLDMATTEVSQGRLILADQENQPIPEGWAVDAEGHPTTSAAAGLSGALMPAGGPKGFGLAFAIDALVTLSGAAPSPEVGALGGDPATPQRLGHLLMAIRVDVAGPADNYHASIRRLVDAIHEAGPLEEERPAMAPGEPELAHQEANRGLLDVSEHLLKSFRVVENTTGIGLPEPIATHR